MSTTDVLSFYEHQGRYRGILGWIFSTDHKRIGLLYLVAILTFFFTGVILGFLMRLELIAPGPTIMKPQTYNAIFTLHGVIMIFLFVIPGIPSIFGNFFLPIQIGARDVAFPRVNLLSWWDFGNPVSFYRWGSDRYRVDVLRSLQSSNNGQRPSCCFWSLHPWFFFHSHGDQFCDNGSPAASPGNEMVSSASFRMEPLCDGVGSDSRHTGRWHYSFAYVDGETGRRRGLRSNKGRRSNPLPAPFLDILSPSRIHHDPASHGNHLRDDPRIRPEDDLRL